MCKKASLPWNEVAGKDDDEMSRTTYSAEVSDPDEDEDSNESGRREAPRNGILSA